MKLLDTSIIIYAQGRPHRYYEPCRALVARLVNGSDEYGVDTELLQEVLHVYGLRGERARAFRTFDRLITLFPRPFPITAEEMSLARQLFEQYPVLSSRDAIHIAVVFTQRLEGIVTTDAAFGAVQGVTVYDPLTLTSEAP
ncbi:MAG: type II toxin-antitoxin system VapC family toxin [Chloroflexi bacterium]|nr:type II toxin-antitoxin system VapC family toxin [Chloroflexota bacterium]